MKKWLLIIAACLAVEWAAFVGIFWLVTLCFGWNFSFGVATGIWLIYLIVRGLIRSGKGD